MRLEDQVISLELSKELKELGVKRDSYYIWFLARASGQYTPQKERRGEWGIMKFSPNLIDSDECYPAFSVAEIGRKLREYYPKVPHECMIRDIDKWDLWEENEANMRAKLWIKKIREE